MDSSLITPEEKEALEQAKTRILRFLSFRPRSEKEIIGFISKKGFDEKIISHAVEQLKNLKFIDDTEFAKWWIEQRQTFNVKSKFIIKGELLQKGVDKEIINDLLEKTGDDYQTALLTFEKNKHKFKNYSGREFFQKASAFLQRKGFSFETIKKVVKDTI